MNKYILKIDGMACGMCEMHVEDAIKKSIRVKKAKASHLKNQLIVICEDNLGDEDFHKALDSTGYKIISIERTVAVKKLFFWR